MDYLTNFFQSDFHEIKMPSTTDTCRQDSYNTSTPPPPNFYEIRDSWKIKEGHLFAFQYEYIYKRGDREND